MFETKKKYYSPTVRICTFSSTTILAGSGPIEEVGDIDHPGQDEEQASKQNFIFPAEY